MFVDTISPSRPLRLPSPVRISDKNIKLTKAQAIDSSDKTLVLAQKVGYLRFFALIAIATAVRT
ncbi:hypothetical protein [Microcoleus sp. bin38.metabat.b11b12b14.051]|uniref:hypothetical protein n=1 Tax=Microcoleus sp. bin38.metabat.b11b12b14.051 TaxID=2742709 RepID=UPI0025CD50CA|nr:hypothetical protein [Microcoleus sp. bin38.metabat.b11b12b14.051]